MSFHFIDSRSKWLQTYKKLPTFCGKVYYHPDFSCIAELNNEGKACAVYYEDSGGKIFYPFLLKKIPEHLFSETCYDIETAYGYGGPFVEKAPNIDSYLKSFCLWAQNLNIVAEFIRFNPVVSNYKMFNDHYSLSHNRKTVLLTLNNQTQILNDCTPAKRRNYKTACKSALSFYCTKDTQDFKPLYIDTMKRAKADNYYHFNDSYFANLQQLSENMFVIYVKRENMIIAAGLFLTDEVSVHYHLGCGTIEAQKYRANVYYMLNAAFEALKAGKRLMHIGGGLSLNEDDSLFRFKKGFSKQIHDFYIGWRIHQGNKYTKISKKWQADGGMNTSKILHYHQQLKKG